MRILVTLLAGILILSSCSQESGAYRSREFFAEKVLTINPGEPNNPITLTDGSDLVFRYLFNHPQEDNIADDELSEVFIFSIPSDQSAFEITTTDISGGSIFPIAYYRVCFCFFENGFTIQSVSVKGSKINDSKWEVKFEMTATDGDHTYHLTDEGIYKLNTRTI